MEILNGIIFPFLLGLLGFIEPCSMGTNLIFFQYMLLLNHQARLFHSLLFTLTRAIFLSLIGLSSALAGQQIVGIQGHYIILLGIVYLATGFIILIKGQGWSFRLPLPHINENSIPLLMGVSFGLAVPACASPLILALAGGAAISRQLLSGFLSLFVFGVGLSLPLLIMVYSEGFRQRMIRLANNHPVGLRYLVGCVLILAGLYTIFTQNGSLGVIFQNRP
ncbi:MAG: sulfite exporter TauE/SafE family protein [Nitrospirae bacterium]|nr:sulfite exporter TauE/SafE family protein [Nitrospirota bacterium]